MHLDTHVLVWLFGQQRRRIPASAQGLMEREPLAISPMVHLELAYLYEVSKVSVPADEVLGALIPVLELTVSRAPFPAVVARAAGMTWSRDPFDRLIAAQALTDGAALLTADKTLLANVPTAVWDAPATGGRSPSP
ncbi:MAG: PIN domain-containing protein [Nitriliruptorales bacterium]|nr:PIN domain-containing protein [Nitriliruptorales bacterium]